MELLLLFAIPMYLYAIAAVSNLASRLGRSSAAHTVVSIFITPIPPMIYLLCSGETDEARKARVVQEEKWRRENC